MQTVKLNKVNNIKLKVNWLQERADDNDDNGGKHFGIYLFDCTEEEYDEEAGYGSYDILEAFWYDTEKERDENFEII